MSTDANRTMPDDTGFPETEDIHTASKEYADRFRGASGQWMLDVQERITLEFLADRPDAAILDVGGGHGQLTVPLCRKGHHVTVVGSDESCQVRLRDVLYSGRCVFRIANVIDLPFEDNSFDVVICFRLLTHCKRWPELISELCRVARERVIIDYPTSQSLNKIAPALFKAKKRIEKNTREWRLFKHEEVYAEFDRNGFELTREKAQFFLPMVLHRALKCKALSAGMEAVCRKLGLTRLWGSPVIMEACPQEEEESES